VSEKKDYKICSKCIMDNENDPNITFNEQGVCNHCITYDSFAQRKIVDEATKEKNLAALIKEIKSKGKQYDCVIGVSGGVDSTYVSYLVKELGLNPLAVHLDNGWNSKLAVKNIQQIITKLDIDLYTHVIDWQEFKDLQLSYLKASVVDIELLTDHAIVAILYKIAAEHKIKYILNGENVTSEGVLPSSWVHHKNDLMNIKDIHKQYGKVKIKTFPTLGLFKDLVYRKVKGIKMISILNYIDYNKFEAKKIITEQLDWKDYGGKHYESIFTRFYQAYILPVKFNIDKRRSHLSSLICSGQLSKEKALEEIKLPTCDPEVLKEDKNYVAKKFDLTEEEFDKIMMEKPILHTDYKSVVNYYNFLRRPYRYIKYRILRRKDHEASAKSFDENVQNNLNEIRIAVLLNGSINDDNRVIKVISTLSKCAHIDLYYVNGDSESDLHLFGENVSLWNVPYKLSFKQKLIRHTWFCYEYNFFIKEVISRNIDYNIIIANDLPTLYAAYKLSVTFNAKLIYDSHEIYNETLNQFFPIESPPFKKFVFNTLISIMRNHGERIEKKYAPKTSGFITVNGSLKEYFKSKYELKKIMVIMNWPNFKTVDKVKEFRADYGWDKSDLVFIYQGVLNEGRGLKLLLETWVKTSINRKLIILGDGPIEPGLKAIVSQLDLSDRVKFIPKVSLNDLLKYTAGADVGINLLEDLNLSKKLASPNKLYEYIHANIPVLCSNTVENNKVLETFDVGISVENNSDSILKGIESISGNHKAYSVTLSEAAQFYKWENQEEKIKSLIK